MEIYIDNLVETDIHNNLTKTGTHNNVETFHMYQKNPLYENLVTECYIHVLVHLKTNTLVRIIDKNSPGNTKIINNEFTIPAFISFEDSLLFAEKHGLRCYTHKSPFKLIIKHMNVIITTNSIDNFILQNFNVI